MSEKLEAIVGDCPTCGQDMPIEDRLILNEDARIAVVNGIALTLTETYFELLSYFVEKQPNIGHKEGIYTRLYGHKPEADQPEIKIIDVLVCKLREQFEGTGVDLYTVWGRGWGLMVHSITAEQREEFMTKYREKRDTIEERNELAEPHLEDIGKVAQLKAKRKAKNISEFSDDLGPKPEIKWVPLDQIIVDHNYQRELNATHVRRIALNFKWAFFQTPSLAIMDGGGYVALDGQHRIEAARAHPHINEIPAYITELPEAADQAEAFVMTNKNRLGVNPVNIYWASITAGKREYIEMKELLDGINLEIVPYLGYSGVNKVSAVSTLFSAQKRHGPESLIQALTTLRDAYSKDKEAFKASLIGGMTKLFASYDNVDPSRVISILQPHSPKELGMQAYYVREELGGSSANAFFEAVRRMYNADLKENDSLSQDASKFLPLKVDPGKTGKRYYKV